MDPKDKKPIKIAFTGSNYGGKTELTDYILAHQGELPWHIVSVPDSIAETIQSLRENMGYEEAGKFIKENGQALVEKAVQAYVKNLELAESAEADLIIFDRTATDIVAFCLAFNVAIPKQLHKLANHEKFDYLFTFEPLQTLKMKPGRKYLPTLEQLLVSKQITEAGHLYHGRKLISIPHYSDMTLEESMAERMSFISKTVKTGVTYGYLEDIDPLPTFVFGMAIALQRNRSKGWEHYYSLIMDKKNKERDYGVPFERRVFTAYKKGRLVGGLVLYNADIPEFDNRVKVATIGELFVHYDERISKAPGDDPSIAITLLQEAYKFAKKEGYNLFLGKTQVWEYIKKNLGDGFELMEGVFENDELDPIRKTEKILAKVITPIPELGLIDLNDYTNMYGGQNAKFYW